MNDKEKAKIILDYLDKYAIQIEWNREDHFLKAIEKGLEEINRRESKKGDKHDND